MAASCSTSEKSDINDLPDQPYQPSLRFKFPSRSFGLSRPVKRSFQSSWFQRFPWIHYNATLDCALCFTCCKAAKQGKVKLTGLADQAFLIKGFTNWKDATRVYSKHESSDFHKQAVAAMANKADVGEMFSSQLVREKQTNREYLLNVMSIIRFLARQALPLRRDGNEKDSNFYQLLVLRSESMPEIKAMMEKKQLKYTSHEIQNELLNIMAQQVLRKVVHQFQSTFLQLWLMKPLIVLMLNKW